jgi:hypothetical protein
MKRTAVLLSGLNLFLCSQSLPTAHESSGVYLSEARKYVSLPDLNDLNSLKLHNRDVNIWASKMRAARRSAGGERANPRPFRTNKSEPKNGGLAIQRESASGQEAPRSAVPPPHEPAERSRLAAGNGPAGGSSSNADAPVRSAQPAGPFQRLIELPLWQTSLLSAKYVLHHESDVVTYRERTFPTARSPQTASLALPPLPPNSASDAHGGEERRVIRVRRADEKGPTGADRGRQGPGSGPSRAQLARRPLPRCHRPATAPALCARAFVRVRGWYASVGSCG